VPGNCLALGVAIVAMLAVVSGSARAAEAITAIETPGSGTLTICRDWLVYDSCSAYHNVVLPRRLTIGDEVKLTFGSNLKEVFFPVVAIRRDGSHCTVLSNAAADKGGNKIDIDGCTSAPAPTGGAQR
jgi:hypothetical protein